MEFEGTFEIEDVSAEEVWLSLSDPYMIKGSLPGPNKRVLRLRPAVRPTETPRLDPEVRYVSTASDQG